MAEINSKDNGVVHEIIKGKKDFLSLDFSSLEDRAIAIACMDKNQLLARRLDISLPDHMEILKRWIAGKFENLLVLTPEQRCKELIDIFLERKFGIQQEAWKKEKFVGNLLANRIAIIRSYTKQLLLCYNYETKEGELVNYFDEKLGIPAKLKTDASIKLKVLDSLKLVKKIDIELERIDLTITVNLINGIIAEGLREVLLDVIETQKLSYYDLPKHYVAIRDVLVKKLQTVFGAYGLEVSELTINDICLTSNINEQLEDQYFALAKISRVKDFEYQMEERSLKLYEQKASIHSKYPSFEGGLTEAEKDLALARYLRRTGDYTDLTSDVKRKGVGQRTGPNWHEVSKVDINAPEKPEELKPNRKYLLGFGAGIVLWLVLTIIFCSIKSLVGLGIAIAVIGFAALVGVGFVFRYQLRYGVTKEQKEAHDQSMRAYEQNMNEFDQKDNHSASKHVAQIATEYEDVEPDEE